MLNAASLGVTLLCFRSPWASSGGEEGRQAVRGPSASLDTEPSPTPSCSSLPVHLLQASPRRPFKLSFITSSALPSCWRLSSAAAPGNTGHCFALGDNVVSRTKHSVPYNRSNPESLDAFDTRRRCSCKPLRCIYKGLDVAWDFRDQSPSREGAISCPYSWYKNS